jgi:hypothetical protein
MSQDNDDDIWQACIAMVEAAPDDMPIERKVQAVSLFVSCVALSISNGDLKRTKRLIADIAIAATVLAKRQNGMFVEQLANMPDVSRKPQ